MGFEYEKFERELFTAVEGYAKSHLEEKDDLYIISVDYWPDFTTSIALRANTWSYLNTQSAPSEEDYLYYKYCEEEWDWDIFENLDVLSADLQKHYGELEEKYSDKAVYDERRDAHTTKIIELCQNVLKKFRETDTYKAFPKLYLNIYVRDYFGNDSCIEIFGEINGEECAEEYAGWL